jgi:type VI secretion system protein ImpB
MAATPGKDGAVAPQERINIRYKTETGGVQEDVELPLRLLVLGDFTGRPDTSAAPDFKTIEERKPINIDKNNFDDVLKSQQVGLSLQVDNVVKPEDKELKVELKFDGMKDFDPEGIARQVPELRELLELREALTELKGPLAQNAAFRKKLQALLDDENERASVLDEIGLGPVNS